MGSVTKIGAGDIPKTAGRYYYRGRKVEGASVSSFADLGGGYGKDNWTVYYRGWKVEGASASSFADLGGGYGKDNWTVFYEGRAGRCLGHVVRV